MSNFSYLSGHLVIFLFAFLAAEPPARGQFLRDGNPYDASRRLQYTEGTQFGLIQDFPAAPPVRSMPSIPGTVSADMLRNPLSPKARRALEKAMHYANLGDHKLAIQDLQEVLARFPQAAPYTLTLLGAELVEMRRYGDAADAFGQVARIMPHLSAAHSNLGLSLALAGKSDDGEKELRQALALDRDNIKASHVLDALLVSRRRGR